MQVPVINTYKQEAVGFISISKWSEIFRSTSVRGFGTRSPINSINIPIIGTPLDELTSVPPLFKYVYFHFFWFLVFSSLYDWDALYVPHKKDSEANIGIQKVLGISEQNCFTDFHIDFTGTTAWLHVVQVTYCRRSVKLGLPTQTLVSVSMIVTYMLTFT